MKHLCRGLLIILAALMAPSGLAFAQAPDWRAELDAHSARTLVGAEVTFKLELENVSGHDILMAQQFAFENRFCGVGIEGPGNEPTSQDCVSGNKPSADGWLPIFMTKHLYKADEELTFTDFSFKPRCPGVYSLSYRCRVPAEALAPEENWKTEEIENYDEVWRGSLQSNVVTVAVDEPVGIDKEAYEASNGNPLEGGELTAELLRRFPSSTYAAYAIWQRFAKGWRGVEPDLEAEQLERPYPSRKVLAPCDESGKPSAGSESRLEPRALFRCQNAWMGLVLSHQPKVWVGDEMRLKMATNMYRLGDKEGCAAGLEELAEHGLPYVAAKAAGLLSAMRAKGMLEE